MLAATRSAVEPTSAHQSSTCTATKRAPWYVVPADHKWYTHLIVASAIVEALDDLDLAFPESEKGKRKQLDKVRAALLDEKR